MIKQAKDIRIDSNKIKFRLLVSFTIGAALSYLLLIHNIPNRLVEINSNALLIPKYKIDKDFKNKYNLRNIIAFVLYGRKRTASILFRYLENNLKINGGILDKIFIAVRTNNVEDLKFLESYLNENELYKENYEIKKFNASCNYKELYVVLDDNDLVFKIDDDVVFISNGTFEKMTIEYLKNKHFILSANVVNHPILSCVHARLRAILPFYEVKEYKWEISKNKSEEIDKTIAMGMECIPESKWWENGKLGAIAHESFLNHANNNNLDVYDYNIWDFNTITYNRWSVNFIVIWGRHLNKINETHSQQSDEVHNRMMIDYSEFFE